MAGLYLPSFGGGVAQGLNAGTNFAQALNQRDRQARLDEQNQRQQEFQNSMATQKLGLLKDKYAQDSKLTGLEIKQKQSALDNQQVQEAARQVKAAREAHMPPPPDAWHTLANHQIVPPMHYLTDPKYMQAVRDAEDIVNGVASGKLDASVLNSPDFLIPFNLAYSWRFNRGDNTRENGDTVIDRKVTGVAPGKIPGTASFNMLIKARRPDGSVYKYNAPMTVNRSANGNHDGNVAQIPVDRIVANFHSLTQLVKGAQSPEFQKYLQNVAGIKPEGSYTIKDGYLLDTKSGKMAKLPGVTGQYENVTQDANGNWWGRRKGSNQVERLPIKGTVKFAPKTSATQQEHQTNAYKLRQAASTYHSLYPFGPGPNDPSFSDWVKTNYPDVQYSEPQGAKPKDTSTWQWIKRHVWGSDNSSASHSSQPQAYKSAADVRDAYKAGKLSKEQAARILHDQFGFEQ